MTKGDYVVALPERFYDSSPDVFFDMSPDCAVSRYIARRNSNLPRDKKSKVISKTMRSLRDCVGATPEQIENKTSLRKYAVNMDEMITRAAISTHKGSLMETDEIPYDSVTPEMLSREISRELGRGPSDFLDIAREYVNYYQSL